MLCASFRDSGPWKFCHLRCDLPQVVLGVSIHPADGEREKVEDPVGGSVDPADSLPHSIDQNSVTQPCLSVQGNGTSGLAVCRGGEGNCVGIKWLVSVTRWI